MHLGFILDGLLSTLLYFKHFLDRSVQGRKVQTGYSTLIEAPTHEIQNTESRPDYNAGNSMPYSCVGSLTYTANHVTMKVTSSVRVNSTIHQTEFWRCSLGSQQWTVEGQNGSFLQVLFHFLLQMKTLTVFSPGLYLPRA